MRFPMKRVCAYDVVNAYEATGLIPIRKAWSSKDERGGCAIDALARWSTSLSGAAWADENLDPEYTRGFTDAWDADEPAEILDQCDDNKSYLIGYWDAILCRDAVEKTFDSISEVQAS